MAFFGALKGEYLAYSPLFAIVFFSMQLVEPLRQEVPRIRMQAHLLSVTQKLILLLEYQGIVQNNAPISLLTALNTSITSNIQ
jgi:hypothetical protein